MVGRVTSTCTMLPNSGKDLAKQGIAGRRRDGGKRAAQGYMFNLLPASLRTPHVIIDAALNCTIKISGLRRQIDIVHKQCVNASLAECDNRVGGRADNWLAVVEGRIDDDRHSRSCKKAGYEIVKAGI